MWNHELTTFNDLLCLPSYDLQYLDPIWVQLPQMTLIPKIPYKKKVKLNLFRWFLHLSKASFNVKWWAEDFGLLLCLLLWFGVLFSYIFASYFVSGNRWLLIMEQDFHHICKIYFYHSIYSWNSQTCFNWSRLKLITFS